MAKQKNAAQGDAADQAKYSTWAALKRLSAFIRPYRGLFVGGLFLTILIALINPLRPLLVWYILDNPVLEGDAEGVTKWSLILGGLLVFQGIASYLQIWLTNLLGQSVLNDMREKVFAHIVSLRMKYFDQTPIGTLQTRSISDIETLNNIFSQGLVSIVGDLLTLVTLLILMLYTDWELTLVLLTTLPLMIAATWIFKKAVTKAFRRVRLYVSELNAFLQEHITGMLVVQVFNREKREAAKFDKLNQQHRDAHLDTVLYYSIFFPVIEIITALGLALLVWYGTREVLMDTVTFGALVAFISYLNMFFRPIRMLADRFNSLQLGVVSAERIFKVLDTTDRIEDVESPETEIPNLDKGISVRFKDVRFAYNEDEPVLRGVSFDVPPKATTAIVGATGAGKSSIINVLMRFYDVQSGEVCLNGKDIREIELKTLRNAMGLVMQDVFLFSGTIYENITLGDSRISLEQVKEAARTLKADAFIERLPGGYDYRVGERGATLSAGQRQLLSFIRVMVIDPDLLLLDEATANIDSETEALVQNAVDVALSDRTAIIIAHRLSTIHKADQIIVLKKGEIVERGNHQELLALDGYYKKLYLQQYGKEEVIAG